MSVVLSGCSESAQINEEATQPYIAPTKTQKPIIEPTLKSTLIPTQAINSTPTTTPSPTSTSKPPWIWHESGDVDVPVLLYHHIDTKENGEESRYYVSPEDFKQQMLTLSQLGHETITVDYLVEIIRHGGLLPEKPLVITFDDGQLSVYENAYPIMRDLGFVGTVYIVSSWVGSGFLMDIAEIQELADQGWSIGSHSNSHKNLVEFSSELHYEMRMSKLDLEDQLGVDVSTFAYPFGVIDEFVGTKVREYGYTGAVGLGSQTSQGLFNLYYLSRIEIFGTFSIDEFLEMITD